MTSPSRTDHGSDGTVGIKLHTAITAVVRWATRADVRRELSKIEDVDLHPMDTFLLGAIGDRGPLRASELADRQGVDKSTVTPPIKRMQAAGLISRSPDPDDRRAAHLSLTAKGRRVLRKFRAGGAQRLEGMLTDWSEQDRNDLARLLGRLTDCLEGTRNPPNHRST